MKQTFGILIIFIFLGCSNGKKHNASDSDLLQSETEVEPKIEYQPIFLNLSPKMDFNEFNNNLRNNSELINGNFILPLDSNNSEFKISKKYDRIVLNHSNVKDISVMNLNKNLSKHYLSENEKSVSEFINIFREKYGNEISTLPFNKNIKGEYFNNVGKQVAGGFENKKLNHYGFEKENYLVFQDSLKTILIGYTNNGRIVLSNDELLANTQKPKIKSKVDISSAKSVKEYLSQYENSSEQASMEYSNRIDGTNTSQKFGIDLEINYLHNSDFQKLLQKMEKEKSDFLKAERRIDSIKKSKQNSIDKNKTKI